MFKVIQHFQPIKYRSQSSPPEYNNKLDSFLIEDSPEKTNKMACPDANGLLTIQNFINGDFVPSKQHIDSYDPSTGKVYAKIPESSKEEVDAAAQAAKRAFPLWSLTEAKERCRIMIKIADILESRLAEFAAAESKDQGKTIATATIVDIPRAVHNMRFFATTILHDVNTSSTVDKLGIVNYTTREACGVAGLISPWNLPLYLLTFKIAPAIAWGNTVVAKPSEMTSVTSWMFAKVCKEAGLPDGVLNFTYGTGPVTGDAIVCHPDIHLISFTGSTLTAERIQSASSPFCKKLSLELGGKNPAVIFSDCDFKKAVATTVRSSFANQGEICLCTSRIFVENTIYQKFVEEFVKQAKEFKTGPPGDPSSRMGALISKEHLAKVRGFVHWAQENGGTIQCGLEELNLPDENKEGYFMAATVITDVADTSKVMQEEIFGPVTCIVPFSTEEEVIERANGVKYGLAATVWSKDVGRVHRVARKLQTGTVWTNCWLLRDLNMPFGGIKASGIGREGAKESAEFFTELKTIVIAVD